MGRTVVPIYELPTAELPDLHDGTLGDWEAVLEPSLDHRDFGSLHDGDGPSDEPIPQDRIAFSVYLAWNHAAQRLYVGIQRFDAAFQPARIPQSPGPSQNAPAGTCCWSYDYVEVVVDGDHSGGAIYARRSGPDYNRAQAMAVDNREAQDYQMVAEAIGDRRVQALFFAPVWALEPPYVDFGGFRSGEAPSLSGYELSVTPWDWLGEDPESSTPSRLEAEAIIGLQISVLDFDESVDWAKYLETGIGARFGLYTIAGVNYLDASHLVDAILLPCAVGDCSGAVRSAVRADSWGRIKASFDSAGR